MRVSYCELHSRASRLQFACLVRTANSRALECCHLTEKSQHVYVSAKRVLEHFQQTSAVYALVLFFFSFAPASDPEGRSKANLLISTLKDSIRADKCHLPWEYWTMTPQIGWFRLVLIKFRNVKFPLSFIEVLSFSLSSPLLSTLHPPLFLCLMS